MRKPFVAGNWKMHGSRQQAQALATAIKDGSKDFSAIDIAIFPSCIHQAEIAKILENSSIIHGAQNFYPADAGAFTGEISLAMLQDYHCESVLIGHSERRQTFHENETLIAEKLTYALSKQFPVILCIGETLAQREKNQTNEIITQQLKSALTNIPIDDLKNLTIAYEPIWAIGTGLTASPAEAQEVHAKIRAFLQHFGFAIGASTRILYGGSVKADNAAGLFAMPDIDGALVGGASLDATSFLAICAAANLQMQNEKVS